MTSQTTGAAPGPSSAWPDHVEDAMAYDEDCAPLLSLADGAADVRVRRAPAGGRGGGEHAVGVSCAPPVVAAVPCPDPPRDLLRPPLRATDLHTTTTYLRPALRASAGTRRGVPAAQATNRAGTPA